MMNSMRLVIFVLLLVSLQLGYADGVANIQSFFANTQTMQADFEQKVTNKSGDVVQQVKGRMQLKRPNMFRWDYHQPYEQQIISDGHEVFLYDVDLEQVTVRALDKALGATPAALLAGGTSVADNFILKNAVRKDDLDWVLVLPKHKDGSYNRILLGFRQGELKKMEFYDNFSHVTHIKFANVKQNPAIPDENFLFLPPESVDVVGK